MKDLIICGLLVSVGFGVAHVRASNEPRLRRTELLATVGAFTAAVAVAFLVAHPQWWLVSGAQVVALVFAPLFVGLSTWTVGEAVLRWSRHPVLGLLGALAGVGLALFACGRFDPGPVTSMGMFLPLAAGAFAGYQLASGGRRNSGELTTPPAAPPASPAE